MTSAIYGNKNKIVSTQSRISGYTVETVDKDGNPIRLRTAEGVRGINIPCVVNNYEDTWKVYVNGHEITVLSVSRGETYVEK